MKKLWFLLLLQVYALQQSSAQRDEGASLGVRAGAVFSFFSFPGLEATTSPGASVGFFSRGPIDGDFYIQPELYGTFEKTEITDPNVSGGIVELKFIYAECTFMAAYYPAESLCLHVGPFVGYLAHYKATGGWPDSTGMNIFDRENFNDVNLGFIYGATYELKRFDVGLRYNHGLFIIGKELARATHADALKSRNAYLQLFVGYLF